MRQLTLFAVLLVSSISFAGETRFVVDPAQDLAALAKSGKVVVQTTRKDKRFTLDASAVVRTDIQKLFAVSVDYDNYVRIGMPDLKEIHVVERGPGDILYTWQDLATQGRESKHYFEVHTNPKLTHSDAKGSEWTLIGMHADWPYEENSLFTSVDGSWYIEPQADGSLYVRYFMTATIDSGIPGFILDLFVKGALTEDIRKVVETLVAASKR